MSCALCDVAEPRRGVMVPVVTIPSPDDLAELRRLSELKPEPVETVTSTGDAKPPKRAHSMTIRLHAHDIDELFDVLSEIVAEQRRDGAHSVVSSCGYDVEYVCDPLQTEGRYRDQLDQYVANIRGSGR